MVRQYGERNDNEDNEDEGFDYEANEDNESESRESQRRSTSNRSQRGQGQGGQINLGALADMVADRVHGKTQTQERQEQRDEILETAQALRADGWGDNEIKFYLMGARSIEQKFERKMEALKNALQSEGRSINIVERATGIIDNALVQAYRDNPDLKMIDKSLREAVINDYFATEGLQAQFNAGHLDTGALTDICDEVIDKFASRFGGEKPKGTTSAMKPPTGGRGQKVPSETGKPREIKSAKEVDLDRLEDHQREFYNDTKFAYKKKLEMSEEDASVKAFNSALRIPKPKRVKSVFEKRAMMG